MFFDREKTKKKKRKAVVLVAHIYTWVEGFDGVQVVCMTMHSHRGGGGASFPIACVLPNRMWTKFIVGWVELIII
jgi:hypothetical protein